MIFLASAHYAFTRASANLGGVALAVVVALIGNAFEIGGVVVVMSGIASAFLFGFLSEFTSSFNQYYASRKIPSHDQQEGRKL